VPKLPVSVDESLPRVAVLITSHNRRELTTSLLESLRAEQSLFKLQTFLVDDGSKDGTPESVESDFPEVFLIKTDGTKFWCKSMALAERVALTFNPDYIVWLNDDVKLIGNALTSALALTEKIQDSIVVGSVIDEVTGEVTYGGRKRLGRHPQKFSLVQPSLECQLVDAFHGNFVIIPTHIARKIGQIDDNYAHAFADDDYSLRASEAGVPILLAPIRVGFCTKNDNNGDRLSRLKFVAWLFSRKGRPIKSQWHYLRKFGGRLWIIYFFRGYLRALTVGFLSGKPLGE